MTRRGNTLLTPKKLKLCPFYYGMYIMPYRMTKVTTAGPITTTTTAPQQEKQSSLPSLMLDRTPIGALKSRL